MKFDDLLKYVGDFGFYQKRIILTICISNTPAAFHQMGSIFLAATAEFWCTTSEFADLHCPSLWNLTEDQCQEAKNSFLTPSEGEQCLRYRDASAEAFIRGDEPGGNWSITQCDHWLYDTSQYKSTIITEWDLVCDDDRKAAMSQSLFFVGVLIGSVVVGYCSDRFGRKPAFFLSMLVQCISGIVAAFAPNFAFYVCLRCIVAVCNFGMFTLCYIIGTEWVGPAHRKSVAIYISIMWAMGYMLLAALAYFIPTWRTLAIAIASASGILLIFYPFTPESARWLMIQGRHDESMKELEKAAKFNRKSLPEFMYDKCTLERVEEEKFGTILDLFRTPNMRKKTIVMMFNWFVVACVYYGLSLGTSDLGVNDIAFWISGIVEIPACLLVIVIVDRIGRRWSLCGSFIIGGIACILTIWTPRGVWMVTTAMIGKFSVTFGFALVYLFAAEIFPTPVRSTGVGISSTSALIGGIISPLLLEIKKFWDPLHLICYGSLSIMAGLITLLLPETTGKHLPETLEEGENFGLSRKRFNDNLDDDKKEEEEVINLKTGA